MYKKLSLLFLLLLPLGAMAQEKDTLELALSEVQDTLGLAMPQMQDTLRMAATNVRPPCKFRIAVHGGYAYRIAKMPENISEAERQYVQALKHGPIYGADASWYFKNDLGAGVRVSSMHAGASSYGTLIYNDGHQETGKILDKINIFFVGPQFSVRHVSRSGNSMLVMNIAFGYMQYKDAMKILDSKTIAIGGTVGYGLDFAYEFRLAEWLWLGAQISGLSGSVGTFKVDDGTTRQTLTLDADEWEGLTHVNVAAGIRICL